MINDDIIMTSLIINYYGSRMFLIYNIIPDCLGYGIYFNGKETVHRMIKSSNY